MANEGISERGQLWQLRVECHAGYKADQRPIRFFLGTRRYEVQDVLDQWYEPEHTYFKLLADDGNIYIVRRGRSGVWTLESFRRQSGPGS